MRAVAIHVAGRLRQDRLDQAIKRIAARLILLDAIDCFQYRVDLRDLRPGLNLGARRV
ncbi:MAG: hypothetical protein ACTHMR_15480 [Thermomicrobiales bacterium]